MRTSIESPEYVDFLRGHSAAMHVFNALQIFCARALAHVKIYRDFWKAYSRVHLASLRFLLRNMGVLAILVDLLQNWISSIRTRLRVTGTLSEAYSMLACRP
jgi:hypothetical protein